MSDVPSGWMRTPLGQLGVSVRKSVSAERHQAYELWSVPAFSEGVPEVVRGSEIGSAKLNVAPGDVLICKINPRINRVWRVRAAVGDYQQIASPEWIVFRPAAHVDGDYLRLCLSAPEFRKYISESVSGVTGSHTRAKSDRVLRFEVALPPLDEQRRIVAILEDHLSRLDAATSAAERAFSRAEVLKQSLLEAAFRPQGSGVPEGIPSLSVGQFASVRGGKRLPKGTPWSESPTSHRYIRATDIKDGVIREEDLVYVPDEVWPSIARYVVANGDVVITIAGTIGSVAVVPEALDGVNLTENAAKISVDPALVNPEYLAYYLRSPSGVLQIQERSRATTQAKLALYRIEEIALPVPSLARQREVVSFLNEAFASLKRQLPTRRALTSSATGLRRALLSAAFSGQLSGESNSV